MKISAAHPMPFAGFKFLCAFRWSKLFPFFQNVTYFSKSTCKPHETMSANVLKYTRADLATLTYHPVRPLDVISKEVTPFLKIYSFYVLDFNF